MQETNDWRKCNDCEIDITGLNWRLTRCQPCRDRKYIYQHGKEAFDKRKRRLCFVCLKSISDIHLKYNTCHECRKKRPRKKQNCILCGADIINKKMNAKYCDPCVLKKKKKVRKCKKCGVIVERRLKTLCDSCEYKRDHVVCPKCGKERYVQFAKGKSGKRCKKCAEKNIAKKQKDCKRCGDLVVPQLVGKVYCDRCAYERLHPVCIGCGKRIGDGKRGNYKTKMCRPCYILELKYDQSNKMQIKKPCFSCRRIFSTIKSTKLYCVYCERKRWHCAGCGKKFSRVYFRKTGRCMRCSVHVKKDHSIKDKRKNPFSCKECGRDTYKISSNQQYCTFCRIKTKHFVDRRRLPQGMI